jgi:FtsZ-binding cell division protein ZapB
MDSGTIITVLTGAAAAFSGYVGGKRMGHSTGVQDAAAESQTAVNTVELLQVAVAELQRQNGAKTSEVADLRGRVAVLEEMVTQRAEVSAVHDEVKGIRNVVDAIAGKVGA